jgi:hypothetical protein
VVLTVGSGGFPSVKDAIDAARAIQAPIWIAGGARVYREAIEADLVDLIYFTRVHRWCLVDTRLPWFVPWMEEDARTMIFGPREWNIVSFNRTPEADYIGATK